MTKLHIVAGTTGHKTAHLNQKGSMARNITASEYKEVLEQTLLPEGRSAQRDYTRGTSPNGQQAGPLWVPPPTKRVRKERQSDDRETAETSDQRKQALGGGAACLAPLASPVGCCSSTMTPHTGRHLTL